MSMFQYPSRLKRRDSVPRHHLPADNITGHSATEKTSLTRSCSTFETSQKLGSGWEILHDSAVEVDASSEMTRFYISFKFKWDPRRWQNRYVRNIRGDGRNARFVAQRQAGRLWGAHLDVMMVERKEIRRRPPSGSSTSTSGLWLCRGLARVCSFDATRKPLNILTVTTRRVLCHFVLT